MQRREFIQAGTTAAATILAAAPQTSFAANDKINVCVMGIRGRGGSLLQTFAALPEVNVKYVCDLDPVALGSRLEQLDMRLGKKPTGIQDYRKALDDKSLDAIVIGTPEHWHALPTIHACQAGKDVYVEKPDGHNILEGLTMVAAAKKYKRVVQLGTQARSGEHQLRCMAYIATGALGKVRFAKAWESSRQAALKPVPDSAPPAGVDYDVWLGPAPKRPFNVNRFHGNWRWYFDYGTGDLGNDGVHRMDIARWGMETAIAANKDKPLGMPTRVAALGGKYYFDDVQEWPDTYMATFDFAAGYLLTYEMRIWSAYHMHEESEGAAVYGDAGSVVIGGARWRAFDAKGKLIKEDGSEKGDMLHAKNFLDCMRSRKKPNADLETIGQPSSLFCHLGNAAWRTQRTLSFDYSTNTFGNDAEANALLTRKEYRAPYLLPKIAEV